LIKNLFLNEFPDSDDNKYISNYLNLK